MRELDAANPEAWHSQALHGKKAPVRQSGGLALSKLLVLVVRVIYPACRAYNTQFQLGIGLALTEAEGHMANGGNSGLGR